MYCQGKGAKNLIFLHGGAAQAETYQPLLDELAKAYKVYAFDLPGHGEAPVTSDVEAAVELVAKQIRDLSLYKFSIVGHSFGGYCGFRMLEKFNNIESLVLIDPMLARYRKSLMQFLYWYSFTKEIEEVKNPVVLKFLIKGRFDAAKTIYLQNINAITTLNLLVNCIYARKKVYPKFLKKVRIEVLLGNKDKFMPKKNLPKRLQEMVVEIEGDHDWLMADVVFTRQLIESFIGKD